MENYTNTESISDLKDQARRLRSQLRGEGVELSHSKALELVAQQHGARDWNTLYARVGNAPPPLRVGDRVSGRYLGQQFTGIVKALALLGTGDRQRITLHFDNPVDVVTFESFSSMRQRVSGVIGSDGVSFARTSDGQPHLVVSRA